MLSQSMEPSLQRHRPPWHFRSMACPAGQSNRCGQDAGALRTQCQYPMVHIPPHAAPRVTGLLQTTVEPVLQNGPLRPASLAEMGCLPDRDLHRRAYCSPAHGSESIQSGYELFHLHSKSRDEPRCGDLGRTWGATVTFRHLARRFGCRRLERAWPNTLSFIRTCGAKLSSERS